MTRFFLCLAALAIAQDRPPDTYKGGRIEWRLDYDRELERAKKDRRPVLVYFTEDD